MKTKSNLILIGMSGAGKSTLGVLLAKALGKHFTDTDIIIQQKTGRLLQQIIDADGVDTFLKIEEETVSSLALSDHVIATGGSVVYSDRAMKKLQQNGTVVYLDLPYEEIASRLSNITTRGIVFKNRNDLRSVYEERLPLYRRYADLTVHPAGHDIESSVEAIIKHLSEETLS